MQGAACNPAIQRSRWTAILAIILLLLTACGSGAEETSPDRAEGDQASPEAAVSKPVTESGDAGSSQEPVTEFCGAALDLFYTVAAAPGGEDAKQVLDNFESTAPAELKDHVGNLLKEMRPQPVGEQPVALSSDESHMADDAIRSWMADSCGYKRSEVTGVKTDDGYAFRGMEDVVEAGPHDFSLTRDAEKLEEGDVPMEIAVLRPVDQEADLEKLLKLPLKKLNPAVAAAVEGRPQPKNADQALVEAYDAGYAHDFSGEEMAGHAFVDLEPGTYAIANSLYKDPNDPKTAYYLDGMYDVFEVR